MVWIHYLTNLAMQSGVNLITSTVRKNITSVMFAHTTFTPYLQLRYKCKMQKCLMASLHVCCLSVSVCPSICLYIQMERLGFSLNLICEYFSKTTKKIQVPLKSDKTNGYLT